MVGLWSVAIRLVMGVFFRRVSFGGNWDAREVFILKVCSFNWGVCFRFVSDR